MMRRLSRLTGFSIAILFLLLASAARGFAQGELAKGKIIEKVVCQQVAGQSYALYLPSGYTPEKHWPILYAFAPDARGQVPVERFQEAAEKYGWIVAGSLNSENGSMKQSMDAVKAMWDDTHARFRIDDKRVYTTGFSGGARVAAWVAYLCDGCVAGVIGHGAGFHQQITPTSSTPASSINFIFYGAVGTDDFNFGELRNLDEVLTTIKIPHRVTTFAGGHMWAPKEVCMRAVEWMEVQAIKAGKREKSEALLDELWKSALATARRAEDEGRVYDAYLAYTALVEDFRGLRDTAEFDTKSARMKDTPDVSRAIKEDRDQIKQQQRLEGELRGYQEKRRDLEQRAQAVADFRRVLENLRKKARSAEDSFERRVARRTLHGVFAFYFESAMSIISTGKNYPAAVFNLEAASEMAENNPNIIYELASAYALNGDKKKALETLRRAVEKGFKDSTQITENAALAPLRKEPEYQKILEIIKEKQ
ncbi:MAG TPA: tetratricopeptide repeat protein [Pyrinomonadaceae bacterium]|jgi:predicted esterase